MILRPSGLEMFLSQERQRLVCVPFRGSPSLTHSSPRLTRWAMILRPSGLEMFLSQERQRLVCVPLASLQRTLFKRRRAPCSYLSADSFSAGGRF